jgi:hypothetical protein
MVNLYKAFKATTLHLSLILSMATVFPICFILVAWVVNFGSDLEAGVQSISSREAEARGCLGALPWENFENKKVTS